jgi:hypothetical protein
MERVRATPAAKGGNFVPKPDLTRYDSLTRNCFVARNNSLAGAVVTDLVPRWGMVLLFDSDPC